MEELEAIEARLWAILAPYRDRLEEDTVYGLVMLKRPGATKHQLLRRCQGRDEARRLPPDARLLEPGAAG